MKTRAIGAQLPMLENREVSMFGQVLSVVTGTKSIFLKSTDNTIVEVQMKYEPDLATNTLIEVHGLYRNARIEGDYYIAFPDSLAKTFDAEMDTEAVVLSQKIANAWK